MTDSKNDTLAIELHEVIKDAFKQNSHTTQNLLVILNKLYHADLLQDRHRFFQDLEPMLKAHVQRCTNFLKTIKGHS